MARRGSQADANDAALAVVNDALQRVKEGDVHAPPLVTLGEILQGEFGGEIPDPPSGPALRGLPRISEATGGLFGMWVLGGMPKVGKSAFALQVALDRAEMGDRVLYLDFENGPRVLLARGLAVLRNDKARLSAALQHVYYRYNYVSSLDGDLDAIEPPAIIVIDSVQKLPGNVEHKRAKLEQWVRRFETYKGRGYTVLALSEMPRSAYEWVDREGNVHPVVPQMGGFAETRELEYSADVAAQMVVRDGEVEFHIVANRHRERTGHVATLYRVRDWAWRERDSE